MKILIVIAIVWFAIQAFVLTYQLCYGFWKYFLTRERDLLERYGEDSWVIITGASSGQGRQFALGFAARGFNLLLLGSPRTHKVVEEIQQHYPKIQVRTVILDFGKAFEEGFFDPIVKEIEQIGENLSILVNNVAHRAAWIGYEHMPSELIGQTISCGTMTQARLCQLAIAKFVMRKRKSAIINVTALCLHPNFGLGVGLSNEISLPYLSVYEAANAFGFYHANSLYLEYKNRIDMLNVTPGAVITENTQYLLKTPFQIDSAKHVRNVFRLLGNVQGHTCAYWGHALSIFLINLMPWRKNKILFDTGEMIARKYLEAYKVRD